MTNPVLAENNHVHLQALSAALNLAMGERAELADADATTGDYRVFYVALAATPEGGAHLVFELHRQTPQLQHWLFELLSLTLGAPDAHGLCPVEAYASDAGLSLAQCSAQLPALAPIIAALQKRQKPTDAQLKIFMSRSSQVRWEESKVAAGAL